MSIKWCTNEAIRTHLWDHWWMVFDKVPYKNLEVTIYFLKKLYVEFVKGQKDNYWSMRSNMGVGGGTPYDRPMEK